MTKHLTKPIRAIHFMVLAFLMTFGTNISFDGSVSNGNYVNIYVDDVVVASGIQPAYTKKWDIEDTVGRYVSYETVSEPHNEYLQVATWSEISEITILRQGLKTIAYV